MKTRIFTALIVFLCAMPSALLAHEKGAPFSGAIIDPLDVHHAHIEDEQRINFFRFQDARVDEDRKKNALGGSLEMATAWDKDFRWGSEVFLPFSNAGLTDSWGLGDIELWPLKHALVNRPETILAGVVGFKLPTGDQSKGLGSGKTFFEPHIFLDQAYKNWFLGVNLAAGVNVKESKETDLEYSTVLSYSWIEGTSAMAPTSPNQPYVPALSLELLGETGLEAGGKTSRSIIPGLNIWHTKSGWSLRFGAKLPLTSERSSDRTFLVQLGNHLSWGKLFGRRS